MRITDLISNEQEKTPRKVVIEAQTPTGERLEFAFRVPDSYLDFNRLSRAAQHYVEHFVRTHPQGGQLREAAALAYMMAKTSIGVRSENESEEDATAWTSPDDWLTLANALPAFFATIGAQFSTAIAGMVTSAEWQEILDEKKDTSQEKEAPRSSEQS